MAWIGGRLAHLPVRKRAVRRRARRGRLPCPPARAVWGSVVLVALVLAVPVIVAANPVDPTWLPGFYDDADPEQLVSQALSPESWLGATIPVVLCVLSTIALAWSRRLGWRRADRTEQVARAPPGLPAVSTRVVSADRRSVERAPLAHLIVRRSSSLLRLRRASTSGIDTAGIEEGEKGSPASIPRSSLSGTDKALDEPMRRGLFLSRPSTCERPSKDRAWPGRAGFGMTVRRSVVTVCCGARPRGGRHWRHVRAASWAHRSTRLTVDLMERTVDGVRMMQRGGVVLQQAVGGEPWTRESK
jgi:hypothetical protein